MVQWQTEQSVLIGNIRQLVLGERTSQIYVRPPNVVESSTHPVVLAVLPLSWTLARPVHFPYFRASLQKQRCKGEV